MELKIKKVEEKIPFDTEVQGCWSDCFKKYVYSGYNKDCYDEGIGCCTRKKKYGIKTSFWH